MDAPLSIDVVSDVVCPWCYVGKRRLEHALAQRPELQTAVTWHPFFLDGRIPREGIPRTEYISKKFGIDGRLTPTHEKLVGIGAPLGIDFAFDRIERQPNTLDSHRVIAWAQDGGNAGPVADRLFRMFFSEGRDLSDPETLVEAGVAGGMDADELRRDLGSDRDVDLIGRRASAASSAGISGVPFFVFGKKVSVAGAHEVDVLLKALDHAVGSETDLPTAT
jgi:predicted DsbA family dithiol-disulfide isomerase